jgi:hypothetical protein
MKSRIKLISETRVATFHFPSIFRLWMFLKAQKRERETERRRRRRFILLLFTNACLWCCWVSCNNIPSNKLEYL